MGTAEQQTTVVENGPPLGFFDSIVGVFTAPRETFLRMLRKPGFWLPLVVIVAINLAFTGIWLSKVDPGEFMKAQMIESGQWDKMPAESRQQVVEAQGKFFPIFAWVAGVVGAPIFLAVISGALLFVYRFFYAGQVTFKQSATMVSYISLAYSLVVVPLMLLILFLKQDWTINPQEVVQANATLFLDREAVSKALWAFAGSIDLLVFWQLWLLGAAFGVATGRRTSSAIWGVVIPWALIVIVKVVWKLVF
jgi:hypothetical protein